ncbi:hypothetical protein PAMA_014024 [Pampus argenteus]
MRREKDRESREEKKVDNVKTKKKRARGRKERVSTGGREGKNGEDLSIKEEEEWQQWRRLRRRFRILDHHHGDQSPGNRVHNGCCSLGNSVVSVRYIGRMMRRAGRETGRQME